MTLPKKSPGFFPAHDCSFCCLVCPPRYYWQSFLSSAVWRGSPGKEKEGWGGVCGGRGVRRGLARDGAFVAFAGKLHAWIGETGADHGLVARAAKSKPTSPVGCDHRAGKSLKAVSKLDLEKQKKPRIGKDAQSVPGELEKANERGGPG